MKKVFPDRNITAEDRIAMAEAYRVYELLEDKDKEKIPTHFVETLVYYGDFKKVLPFENEKDYENYEMSPKGKHLLMYMCTFNNT